MSPNRDVEDAPQPMRQELLDLLFGLAEQNPGTISEGRVYQVVGQSLGMRISGQPYGGPRYAAGRDIGGAAWPRIYDLIVRFLPVFDGGGLGDQFREGVNRILAGYGAAWDLAPDGQLHRVLPAVAQGQVEAAIQELRDPRYAPALTLFNAARDAYDARPRRDRDACANIFDAMESAAKEKYGMPAATFGDVVTELRRRQAFNPQILTLLEGMNTLRNRNFGHGMAAPFTLTPAEVDFTYLTCTAAILLLTRTP